MGARDGIYSYVALSNILSIVALGDVFRLYQNINGGQFYQHYTVFASVKSFKVIDTSWDKRTMQFWKLFVNKKIW